MYDDISNEELGSIARQIFSEGSFQLGGGIMLCKKGVAIAASRDVREMFGNEWATFTEWVEFYQSSNCHYILEDSITGHEIDPQSYKMWAFTEEDVKIIASDNEYDARYVNIIDKVSGERIASVRIRVSVVHVGDEDADTDNYTYTILSDITYLTDIELKLMHSQRMETIGALAGGIAHDIGNSLAVVIGLCELLIARSDLFSHENVIRDIRSIYETASQSAVVTKQLLAYSKQNVIVGKKPTNIVDYLLAQENILRASSKSPIKFNFDGVDSSFKSKANVFIDPSVMLQCLLNLVINASDAIADRKELGSRYYGEIMISVDVTDCARLKNLPTNFKYNGNCISIKVQDNGIGIRRSDTAKIFQPFFTTKIGKGSGMGLAMTKSLIEQMGGHVRVHSESYHDKVENQPDDLDMVFSGTAVTIAFPLHGTGRLSRPDETEQQSQTEERGAATNSKVDTELFRVLLVDDNVKLRGVIASQMRSEGWIVHEASNGESGLSMFSTVEDMGIDLIFTDVVMPKVYGTLMVKNIFDRVDKKGGVRPTVVFISAFPQNSLGEIIHNMVQENENIHFIEKPYNGIIDFVKSICFQ